MRAHFHGMKIFYVVPAFHVWYYHVVLLKYKKSHPIMSSYPTNQILHRYARGLPEYHVDKI